MNISNEHNITIEEEDFYSLDEIVPVSIGNNMWTHDFGTNYWNPVYYCAINNIYNIGVMTETPTKVNKWSRVIGDDNKTSSVTDL